LTANCNWPDWLDCAARRLIKLTPRATVTCSLISFLIKHSAHWLKCTGDEQQQQQYSAQVRRAVLVDALCRIVACS